MDTKKRWRGYAALRPRCSGERIFFSNVSSEDLRQKMLSSIRFQTGDAYRLTDRRDDAAFLLQVLLGLTGVEKRFRSQVIIAVAKFVRKAMNRRSRDEVILLQVVTM